jgi:hypothetical protein
VNRYPFSLIESRFDSLQEIERVGIQGGDAAVDNRQRQEFKAGLLAKFGFSLQA